MDSKARGSVIIMIIIRTCTQRAGKLFTGFVLGCIEDDVWNQIFFGKLSPRSESASLRDTRRAEKARSKDITKARIG